MSQSKFGACDCKECQSYCKRPGWFHPDQIAVLAKNMKLTVQELFDQHLGIDWWTPTKETNWKTVFILAPRLTMMEGGTEYPFSPKGLCAWFKDGKCSIHRQGKPEECAFAHHADHDDAGYTQRRIAIVQAWAKPENQAMITQLLGREPETDDGDGTDHLMAILGRL